MERTVIARWESRSGKHWVEVTEDHFGFAYSAPGAGGSFGHMSRAEVMADMQRLVDAGLFQPDANSTPMHRKGY